MTSSPAAARPLQRPGNPYVLARRPLRPGTRRAATARFSDDVWDLTPALLQRHKNALILNFPTLPAQFRQAARELCHALLARDLPPGERESAPDSIRVYFTALKQFLTWADQRGIPALRAVTPADLDAYNDHLLASGRAVTYQAQRRHAVRLLWLYAGKLTSDALTFDPALLPSWADPPARNRAAENTTQRIPEQVISPLLTWALIWISELAGDVLAALEEWRPLHANTQANRARRHAPACADTAGSLEQLIGRYRAENRPLPGGAARTAGPRCRTWPARSVARPGRSGPAVARICLLRRRLNSGPPTPPTCASRSAVGSEASHGPGRSATPRPSTSGCCSRRPHG